MEPVILIRYLHFIAILGVVSTVVSEHLLLKDKMSRKEILKLSRIDAVYGISAILVVIAGLSLWLWVGKPSEYYSRNYIFHTKFTLFIIVGLLSIVPTIFFAKNRKGDPEEIIEIPKKIIMFIRIELTLLFIMPLLAVMMAYGKGSF